MHEVLPQKSFAARRARLIEALPENSAVVLYGARELQRNSDVSYPFRQDSYFWYFTGFNEADAVALLQKKNGKAHYTLFSQKRNPAEEIWNGRIIGQDDACAHYGADEAYPCEELGRLPELIAEERRLYVLLGLNAENDEAATTLLREIQRRFERKGAAIEGLFNLRVIADEMRLFKDSEERQLIRRATEISAAGHRAAMLASRPGVYEYTVQAALEAEFRRHGCHWSFQTIAASGTNACCLHYHGNDARLEEGSLMMVDAGAEYAGYAGDISRTHPVSGKFSRDQQALYEIVLQAQEIGIANVRPGVTHLEAHNRTKVALIEGMMREGIIGESLDYWLEDNRFAQFFCHGTGHWVGLDVHDVGIYQRDGVFRCYEPHMVVTVEPGLYIQPDDTSVDPRWRGLGVRIEDDILVTEGEPDVLSRDIPKTVAEIEQLLKERV